MDEHDRALLDGWSTDAFGRGLDRAAADRIACYLDLLETWNARLRLTGERDRRTLLRKHVADALACVAWLPHRGPLLDLGTGAGLPGVVLACVRPDLAIVLLDARQRPISFLGDIIRRIPLPNVRAVPMRAEDAAHDPTMSKRHRLVVSRAIRLDQFLRLAKPLLAADGTALAMQTPKTSLRDAEAIAGRHGYRAVEVRDYRLPDGTPRRLVLAR